MSYWLAYCIYRLQRFRVHADGFDGTLALIMGIISGVVWLLTMPAYLKQIGIRPIWMTALVAPYLISIAALWIGLNVIGWSALIVGLIAQFGLGFIRSSSALD